MKKSSLIGPEEAFVETETLSGAANCADAATQVTEQLERLRRDGPIQVEGQFANLDAATRTFLEREVSRRNFLAGSMVVAGTVAATQVSPRAAAQADPSAPEVVENVAEVTLNVNGAAYRLQVDTRASLLDTLRNILGLTGAKKGCNQGTCGACTVHVDGRRIVSCLTLAAMYDGREITTVEGLAQDGILHPLQRAFIDNDAFQCGYCTSGQIMSGVACIQEGHASGDEAELREWMSGNLCRCSAYPGIVAAIQEVAEREGA